VTFAGRAEHATGLPEGCATAAHVTNDPPAQGSISRRSYWRFSSGAGAARGGSMETCGECTTDGAVRRLLSPLARCGLRASRRPLVAVRSALQNGKVTTPRLSHTVDVGSPPDAVWRLVGQPERWLEGYLETLSRSPGYPCAGAHNDHVFRTKLREEVQAQVVLCEPWSLVEEQQEGRTFCRRLRYRLVAAHGGTRLTVEDDIRFKSAAKLASSYALRDDRRRWERSLARLQRVAVPELDDAAPGGRLDGGSGDLSVPLSSGSGGNPEEARLLALNMALNGTPRDEARRHLASFGMEERERAVNNVYGRLRG